MNAAAAAAIRPAVSGARYVLSMAASAASFVVISQRPRIT